MAFSKTLIASTLLSILAGSAVADNGNGNNNIALYWGQNSAGGANTQQNLAYYCESNAADIILLAFLDEFPTNPDLNLGPATNDCTAISGSTLIQCPQVAADIKTCQSLGKKVILSMGGASGAYGFTSDQQGVDWANQLWDLFGAGTGLSTSQRPFQDAIVDGFDLDIEGGSTTGWAAMVNQLHTLFESDTSKDFLITAAPQCPLPDYYTNPAILNSPIDILFVQFYNNYCGLQSYGTDNFNFADWDNYVKTQAFNKNAKVYLGVPASPTAAGSGYEAASEVVTIADSLKQYSTFAGVMMWDASQAWNNNNFASTVKTGISGSNSKKRDAQPNVATTLAAKF